MYNMERGAGSRAAGWRRVVALVVPLAFGLALGGCGAKAAVGRKLGIAGPTARAKGVILRLIPGAGEMVEAPDGRTVATLGEVGTVKLWDTASSNVRLTLRYDAGNRAVAAQQLTFAPDGSTLAALPPGGSSVQIWDARTGAAHRPIKLAAGQPGLAPLRGGRLMYSPDGRTVATAGDALQFWDVATGALRRTIAFPAPGLGSIVGAAFAPDGHTVAMVSEHQGGIWDVATGALVRAFALPSGGYFAGTPRFAPGGRTVVTAGDQVRAWDAATGKLDWTADGDGASYSPDGAVLAVIDGDDILVCDPRTGKRLRDLPGRSGLLVTHGGNQWVRAVAWAPDSRTLAVTHGGDDDDDWNNTPQVWDVNYGIALKVLAGHAGPVEDIQYSPDGHTIITDSDDGATYIWRAF